MRPVFALLSVAVVSVPSVGHAGTELQALAGRLEGAWKKAGADTARLPARFVYDDEAFRVVLPPAPSGGACATVGFVGARGLSFRAKFDSVATRDLAFETEAVASSAAGALSVASCDKPLAVEVHAEAGRGALEVVVAWTAKEAKPLPPMRDVLPERAGGVLLATPEPGAMPIAPPPAFRAAAAEARARRDGALSVARHAAKSGIDGNGSLPIELAEGCHALDVFAVDPRERKRRIRLDVDAELHTDDEDDTVLARDRTDAPDAHMVSCVAEPTGANVLFTGALPGSDVVVTHADYRFPSRIPGAIASSARARMALAIFTRRAPYPEREPIYVGLGTAGQASIPIGIAPGSCYLAVLATSEGHTRALALRATVGARDIAYERGAAEESAIIAFCAGENRRANLSIEARGGGLAWSVAVFALADGLWEGLR